jgi:hypothetical protein
MKLEVGEGYRLLTVGEVLQEGDEWYRCDGNCWLKTKDAGRAVQKFDAHYSYRRKIEPADGWISVKERSPIPPCELSNGTNVWLADTIEHVASAFICISHWKPYRPSLPPKPKVSAEEIAFEAWWRSKIWWPKSSVAIEPAKAAWLAARQYAKDTPDRKGSE